MDPFRKKRAGGMAEKQGTKKVLAEEGRLINEESWVLGNSARRKKVIESKKSQASDGRRKRVLIVMGMYQSVFVYSLIRFLVAHFISLRVKSGGPWKAVPFYSF